MHAHERIAEMVNERLTSVDWDFADSSAQNLVHSIHPYPAKFIPQIPRELIRLFHPGDASPVADIFAGSGTALVESVAAGLPAIGVDLSPLAVLIAKVKTTPLQTKLDPIARDIAGRAKTATAVIPKIPRLDHWFKPEIQQALANLIEEVDRITDTATRDALKVAVSRITVRVSNQESDTRYAAVVKAVTANDVLDLFISSAEFINRALTEEYGGISSKIPSCRLVNRNILEISPDELGCGIGLLVTSPPYPNAYEYWLYHKYRMYWLGMDPIAVRTSEIGARPHYFKKNRQTEIHFEEQMGRCFWLLSRAMRPVSFACLIVGRSIIHGRHIDNTQVLKRAASSHGFQLVGQISRQIQRSRKSFNPATSKISEESIVIFYFGGKS